VDVVDGAKVVEVVVVAKVEVVVGANVVEVVDEDVVEVVLVIVVIADIASFWSEVPLLSSTTAEKREAIPMTPIVAPTASGRRVLTRVHPQYRVVRLSRRTHRCTECLQPRPSFVYRTRSSGH